MANDSVLLAEDEMHDVFLLQRAFRVAEVKNPLVSVSNGQEAIWFLEGHGAYADRAQHPAPCLMLLDLKMPIVSGFEVLEWVRDQPSFQKSLPVIVLTSSDQEGDVRRAFELGASDYLVKPSDFNLLVLMMTDLKRNWLEPLMTGQRPKPSI